MVLVVLLGLIVGQAAAEVRVFAGYRGGWGNYWGHYWGPYWWPYYGAAIYYGSYAPYYYGYGYPYYGYPYYVYPSAPPDVNVAPPAAPPTHCYAATVDQNGRVLTRPDYSKPVPCPKAQ